jgi:hypothetical protein
MGRGLDAQGLQILKERILELLREFGEGNAALLASGDGFVIDIREIHYPFHPILSRFEMALKQVFKNVGAEIADVGKIINSRSAGVHFHQTAGDIERLENFNRTRGGVKQTDGHVLEVYVR